MVYASEDCGSLLPCYTEAAMWGLSERCELNTGLVALPGAGSRVPRATPRANGI